MSGNKGANIYSDRTRLYQVCVQGQLGPHLALGFDGLTIKVNDAGDTIITGSLLDQAALCGILKKYVIWV